MLDLLTDAIRNIFAFLDSAIYSFIPSVYNLLNNIAQQQVFDVKTLGNIRMRVYALMGIFMLFKLAFSLIRYIVNPDEMKDQKKGGKKLIINVMVTLALLIATPMIFDESRVLQKMLLEKNIIGNLIMGTSSIGDGGGTTSTQPAPETSVGTVNPTIIPGNKLLDKTVGNDVASLIFSAFYYPAYGSCDQEIADTKAAREEATDTTIEVAEIDSEGSCIESFPDANTAQAYVKGIAYADMNTVLYEHGVVTAKVEKDGKKEYSIEYKVGVSTVAGVVVLLLFINFCIQTAIRVIKLAFLEAIAPIPIISYVDPKSADSGLFSKWMKMCIATYLSLFIRLASIYFAVFAIGQFSPTGGGKLTTIFIIIGALMFANQLPKMIEELVPSMKGMGDLSLNPLKTIGKSSIAAGAIGLGAGALGGAAANAFSSYNNLKKEANENYDGDKWKAMTGGATGKAAAFNALKSAGKGFKTTAGGFGSAGFRGMNAGLNGGGKGSAFSGASQGIKASNAAREQWAQRAKQGIGLGDVATDKMYKAAGVKNEYGGFGQMDERKQELQNRVHDMSQKEEFARRAMMEWMSTDPMATEYDARTFESFARDKDGYFKNFTDANGQKIKSFASHEDYIGAVERYNNNQSEEMKIKMIADEETYKKFAGLESRTEFYNQEVRTAQKELGKIEKMGTEPAKKS